MHLVQQNFGLFNIPPIAGEFYTPKEPICDESTLWSGEFQDQYNEYFKYNVRFRELLVRIYNQIAYTLYDEIHIDNFSIGKNNQMFQDWYIDAYDGTDFVGVEKINEQCAKLKKIQDTLTKKGIGFLVVLAPGKPDYFPEFIPDRYAETIKKHLPTNYQATCKALVTDKINFIDFNKWFIEHKNKTQYPLYPQGGVHWSMYGSAIAADSIMENMKRISGKNYSDVEMIGAEIRDTIPKRDREVTELMNLLFPLKAYKTAFPIMRFDTVGRVKPTVIGVGDSYFNNLVDVGFVTSTFSPKSSKWGNFNMAHNPFTDQFIYVDKLDIQKEIEQCDFVLLVSTVPNLKQFGWGFIDKVYDIYYKK